ncbi:MAG: carboxypeptidase-like regulatory domain-containing protein, partial [Rikenellaceae bacterium]|nr:carboxypeptidase-like regulatory domain-containing protein [Rikenellaceae bacterium]
MKRITIQSDPGRGSACANRRNLVLRKFFVLLSFVFLAQFALAQAIKVTGKVTDPNGQPLIGVSVIVQGTTTGTSTDAAGIYTINAPNRATLDFLLIGYEQVSEPVNGRTTIDVTLGETSTTLDELVVVGYG